MREKERFVFLKEPRDVHSTRSSLNAQEEAVSSELYSNEDQVTGLWQEYYRSDDTFFSLHPITCHVISGKLSK